MIALVVDASVSLSWLFEDQKTKYTEAVLDRLQEEEAIVPSLWPLEIANVLIMSERKKLLQPAQSVYFVNILKSLPIQIDAATADKALFETLSVARNYQLTSYDASYLELAMREGLPLATCDTSLKKAARRCGVELFSVDH